MGLDMYLYANKYVSRKDYNQKVGEYDYATNAAFAEIVSILNAESIVDNEWSGIHVDLPVGYWRKANQIHAWITDNCADGVDECQRVYISKSKAEELVSICKQVIAQPSLANELLAPRMGFFFGSDEIDEWYINDLVRTVEIFEKLLSNPELAESIYYQASW